MPFIQFFHFSNRYLILCRNSTYVNVLYLILQIFSYLWLIINYNYVIHRKVANFNDFNFLHICAQITKNFNFKIWESVEKIKTVVDRRPSDLKNRKKFNLSKILVRFLFYYQLIRLIHMPIRIYKKLLFSCNVVYSIIN